MNSQTQLNIVPILAVLMFPVLGLPDSSHYDWAKVLDAEPVTQVMRVPHEGEVCWDQQVHRVVPQHRSATPLIFGAIIGGVIGNQFGGGSGKTALTMAGAALGSSIAADEQRRRYPSHYYIAKEKRCAIQTDWRSEERIVAWDVTYRYKGEVYQTRMRDAPGERIRIRVDIQPIE